MKIPSMGNVYLLGADSDVWENPDLLDMISISPDISDNWISRAITYVVTNWYHRVIGKTFKVDILPNS
jgi:hypothetical protein